MNCNTIRPLLSEYIDNALSARDTWQVDSHLADCNACAHSLNELRQTVRLVSDIRRFEVSADFMENLWARIAVMEPERPRAAWVTNLREMFRPRLLPAWGAAACALALIVVMPSMQPGAPRPDSPALPSTPSIVQTARNQSVALAAANPLGDPAAAALIAANASESEESATAVQ